MPKLLRETAIAIAVYGVLSVAFGFGMEDGDGPVDAVLGALMFGVFYFAIGLIIKFVKSRKS